MQELNNIINCSVLALITYFIDEYNYLFVALYLSHASYRVDAVTIKVDVATCSNLVPIESIHR